MITGKRTLCSSSPKKKSLISKTESFSPARATPMIFVFPGGRESKRLMPSSLAGTITKTNGASDNCLKSCTDPVIGKAPFLFPSSLIQVSPATIYFISPSF